MKPFPARIHILLARDSNTGLIIRRGPSDSVATIHWDRKNDTFQVGQWLKGRIYERRSDLSPDGKHFIYFAMNGKWHRETKGSWTAVSRAPFIKSIALYPKGDCWFGGGLWTSNNTFWVNGGETLYETPEVSRDFNYSPTKEFGAECLSVYYVRLLRDGWRLIDRNKISDEKRIDVFQKPLFGAWHLRKIAHSGPGSSEGKGCYWDEHSIHNEVNDISVEKPDWEWADLDGHRLVWASNGQLLTGTLGHHDVTSEKVLCNLNAMKFRPIKAPY